MQGSKLAAVDEVSHGKEVSSRILQIARAIQVVFLIVVIVLLGASTVLISNTIRLSIFARRREIEVMKLVGATNWFVRGPFMLEGVLTGLAGSLAAVLLLFVGRELAVPSIVGHIQDDPDVHALAFTYTAALLVARRARDRGARLRADAAPLPQGLGVGPGTPGHLTGAA